jgi:hypothetical protein
MAYLFECDDPGLFAVSLGASGSNIPRQADSGPWRLTTPFALGIHEPVPIPIAPEPLLRALRSNGYYVWRAGMVHGTTQ